MLARQLIIILLTCFSMHAFSQNTLIGKWRRVNFALKDQDTTNKKLKLGDLELRPDSTFHIEGDSTSLGSNIPGWHTGEELNGNWQLQGSKQLTLWLEPKESRMFLSYVLIKVNGRELVLRSQFDKNNKKADIKYFRL